MVRTHPGKVIIETSPSYFATSSEISLLDPFNLTIPVIGKNEWRLMNKLKTSNNISIVSSYATPMIGEIVFNSQFSSYLSNNPLHTLVLRGGHVQRYKIIDDPKQGEPVYIDKEKWLRASSQEGNASHHLNPRIVYQEASPIDNWRRIIAAYLPENHICGHTIAYFNNLKCDPMAFLAVFNSKLPEWYFNLISTTNHISSYQVANIPFPRINFTTPAAERERLTQQAIALYDAHENIALLVQMEAAIDAATTDVVHDLLAHLAQRMIDLNKQNQTEVKRFLGWLEARLKIRPGKDGAAGIDSLTGKSILQNYLGDYQKGDNEQSWQEFYYRLHQNRNRFAVSLSDVDGEIEREYERSLAVLLPIKRELARTDTLIDKIVYRLYGLTDAEIELIERPQYEQALTDAKAQVMADEQITDDEVKLDKIAENILPAAERFFERVAPKSDEETLDQDLPSWRALPPAAPTFLLTGDYNLRTLPEQMDFSTCVIPYTKAVEVVLFEHIFAPFRATSGYTEADCKNSFLKDFMAGKKHLTLGSFGIILKSTEPALRAFIGRQIPDAANRVFGTTGAIALLNDEQMVRIRNKAAHDEVLTRTEAQVIRGWALGILGQV